MFINGSLNTKPTEHTVASGPNSLNLSMGLGFGLGIPLLLGVCILIRLLYTRRTRSNRGWMQLSWSGKTEAKETEGEKQIESGWPMIGEKPNSWI
jgi:hypothetical protein